MLSRPNKTERAIASAAATPTRTEPGREGTLARAPTRDRDRQQGREIGKRHDHQACRGLDRDADAARQGEHRRRDPQLVERARRRARRAPAAGRAEPRASWPRMRQSGLRSESAGRARAGDRTTWRPRHPHSPRPGAAPPRSRRPDPRVRPWRRGQGRGGEQANADETRCPDRSARSRSRSPSRLRRGAAPRRACHRRRYWWAASG